MVRPRPLGDGSGSESSDPGDRKRKRKKVRFADGQPTVSLHCSLALVWLACNLLGVQITLIAHHSCGLREVFAAKSQGQRLAVEPLEREHEEHGQTRTSHTRVVVRIRSQDPRFTSNAPPLGQADREGRREKRARGHVWCWQWHGCHRPESLHS
jgi:hypothetical protein